MKLRILSLILFVFITSYSFSQSPPNASPFADLEGAMVPPTPNAAALAQYGGFPISHYTGVPNINIPLFSINTRNVSVPIELSYHAGGIKVKQEGGFVGLGWTLNAGGAIIRTIRGGREDESSANGYYNIYHLISDINHPNNPLNDVQKLDQIHNYKNYDTEADGYSYNFNGFAGKLIPKIASDGTVSYLSNHYNDMDFIKTVTGWLVKDENGNEYYFEEEETVTAIGSFSLTDVATTTFYLSKIIDAQSREEITFTYTSYNEAQTSYSESQSRFTGINQNCAHGNGPVCSDGNVDININTIHYNAKRISKISTINYEVVFNLGTPHSTHFPEPINEIVYQLPTGEVIKKYSLTQHYEGSPVNIEREYNRLILDEVVEKDAFNNALPAWKFSYSDLHLIPFKNDKGMDHWGYFNDAPNTTLLPVTYPPSNHTAANRKTNPISMQIGNIERITYPTGGFTDFEFEANQYEVNEDVYIPATATQSAATTSSSSNPVSNSQSITLSKDQFVTFTYQIQEGTATPCAAYVEFIIDQGGATSNNFSRTCADGNGSFTQWCEAGTYTLKAFADVGEESASITIDYETFSHNADIIKYAGGLRIKSTKNYASATAKPIVKTFDYEHADGTPSGTFIGEPQYYHSSQQEYYVPSSNGGYVYCKTCNFQVVTSNPSQSLVSGSPLIYPSVIEKEENNGSIQREFSFFTPGAPGLPFNRIGEKSYLNGKLLKTTIKREDGTLATEESNTYTTGYTHQQKSYTVVRKKTYSASGYNMPANWQVNDFYVGSITDHVGWRRLASTVSKRYDENGLNPIEQTINYGYHTTAAHTQITSKTTTNSNGETLKEEYIYPLDFIYTVNVNPDPMMSAIIHMQDNNQHRLIEKLVWEGSGPTITLKNGTLTIFDLVAKNGQTTVQPKSVYQAKYSSDPFGNNLFVKASITSGANFNLSPFYEEKVRYNGFDENFRPTELQPINGVKHAYQWNEDGTFLQARAANATAAEIDYEGFENTSFQTYSGGYTGSKSLKQNSTHWSGSLEIAPEDYTSSYTFSGFYKTATSTGNVATIRLRAYKDDGNGTITAITSPLNLAELVLNPTNDSWTEFKLTTNLNSHSGLSALIGAGERLLIRAHIEGVDASSSLAVDEIKLYPSNALISTYSYNPKFGPTDMVDANNKKVSYTYDNYGRFKRSFNEEGELLQEVDYHYQIAGEENYVQITTPIRSMTALPVEVTPMDALVQINYADGLGRPIQEISKGITPDQNDLITPLKYDTLGRVDKNYLTYTDNNNSGAFRTNWENDQPNFYRTAPRVAHTEYAFGEVEFDNSPLNRVKESAASGKSWEIGNGETQEQHYRSNWQHEVLNWGVDVNGNAVAIATYNKDELTVKAVIDEEDQAVLTYTDKAGNKVLSKSNLSAADAGWPYTAPSSVPSGNAATDLSSIHYSTYYVYNDLGQLAFVIPPLAVEKMQAAASFNSSTLTDDLLFEYIYDEKGRLIEKKIPGAGWTHYVYDKLDHPILSQTAKQRTDGVWSYVVYDEFNREVLSGLQTTTDDRATQQTNADASSIDLDVNPAAYIAAASIPGSNLEILTVNYYDHYDFDRNGTADYTYNNLGITPIYNAGSGGTTLPDVYSSPDNRTKGLLTGTKVKVMDANHPVQWIETALFYDKKGRLIQSQGNNHLGGSETILNYYDYRTEPIYSKRIHTDGAAYSLAIVNRYDYDHAGRLTKVYQKTGTDEPVILAEHRYNDLGQLIEKNVGSSDWGESYLQSMDYTYNSRGWLTHINNADLSNDALIQNDLGDEEFLSLELDQIIIDVENGILTLREESESTYEGEGGEEYSEESEGETSTELEGSTSALLAIEGETITIDFNGLTIAEGSNAQIALTTAQNELVNELAALGISDQEAIDILWQQLAAYINNNYGSVFFNDDDNDIWGMELKYDHEMPANFIGTPLFNGNIAQQHWMGKHNMQKKGYSYQYDGANRITAAHYRGMDNAGAWTVDQTNYDLSNVGYDANGNITYLLRRGMLQNQTFGFMDDLTYTHEGNRLKAVNDAVAQDGFNDFKNNGVSLNTEYLYDASGNMTQDLNQGFTMSYNHLNLPESVTFQNGDAIHYLYLADGTKVQKKVVGAEGTTITDYVGGLYYEGSELQFAQTAEGRAMKGASDFRYEYHYQDHLGNLRMAFSDLDGNGSIAPATEILQVANYYPFGMEQTATTPQVGPKNLYLYNGKEMQSDFGFNQYFYGARFYNATLGQFHTQDRFAEKYSEWSPYHYANNNPILNIDVNGDSTENGIGDIGAFIRDAFISWQVGQENDSKNAKSGGYKFTSEDATSHNSANRDGIPESNVDQVADVVGALKPGIPGPPSRFDATFWGDFTSTIVSFLTESDVFEFIEEFTNDESNVDPSAPTDQSNSDPMEETIDSNITRYIRINGDTTYFKTAKGGDYGSRISNDKSITKGYPYKIKTSNVNW